MPTQSKGYFLQSGERVPSVTTVLSRYGDKGGLLYWAWKQGKDGKDFREERDIAADAGTMAHAAIDAWLHDQPFDFTGPPEIVDKAKMSYSAFLEWASQNELKITHTELPLISEKYKYGGTFDATRIITGRSMGDWKTSNQVYGEYLMQVAAYGHLWDENFPTDPITAGYWLARFDKKYGDVHFHFWRELDAAWEGFKLLLRLHTISKELAERAK